MTSTRTGYNPESVKSLAASEYVVYLSHGTASFSSEYVDYLTFASVIIIAPTRRNMFAAMA